MASHDIVAQRDYLPKLRDVPVEVDEDEETVKLVQLVKSQEPLVSVHKDNRFIRFNIMKNRYPQEVIALKKYSYVVLFFFMSSTRLK